MIEAILATLAMAAIKPVKAEPNRDPSTWVQARDLPRIDENAAVTTFDLTVDRSGDPVRCTIIIESGANDLDTAVCESVMKRARFRPATDMNGLPVVSVRRDRVVWLPQAAGRNRSYDAADVVITSPEVSRKTDKLAEVFLSFDKEGSEPRCSISETSGKENLDHLACRVASDQQIALPIIDATGERVPGLRSLFIAFEPGQSLHARLR